MNKKSIIVLAVLAFALIIGFAGSTYAFTDQEMEQACKNNNQLPGSTPDKWRCEVKDNQTGYIYRGTYPTEAGNGDISFTVNKNDGRGDVPVTDSLPSAATAPEFNFKFHPIVSVPLPTSGSVQDGTSLSCYLNALFKLAITVSVVLAVIMIVIDGFKYMTSEAAGGKKDALGGMRSAIFGLILLLASWLILNIINPQILSLRVLNTEKTGVGCNLNVPQEQTPQNPTVQGANIPDPLKTPPQSTFGGSSGLSNTPPSANNLQYCFTTNVPAEGQVCGYDLASCNDWRTRDPWKNHQPTICTVPATKK